ncbi:protein SCO1/2 [Verrucomicrobium sp. GAS474]|uniref:SCO family protein n=1 Tax=Verrucomicrobium sp. GAS474 TaxID=1882831 RepID=UPI000879ABC0|nr:SCO family protein [Verrucomicrobium sp. GAS474]SDT95960.1 protein SCO1/2 [Verrucomicrobium sp. GAS474]
MAAPSPALLRNIRLASVVLLFVLAVLWYFRVQVEKQQAAAGTPLPKLGHIDPFTLTGADSQPFDSAALKGKIWAAQFFFTDCGGPCPAVTQNLIQLQGMLGNAQNVKIVALSIDPENDTPEKLRAYAALHHADPARWIFLTASGLPDAEALTHEIVMKRLLIGFQKNTEPGATAATRMIHSTKVVLVDGAGSVRGYYEGLDEETPAKLLADVAALMREEKIK